MSRDGFWEVFEVLLCMYNNDVVCVMFWFGVW